VIDFDALKLRKPELVHDMPANGRRFIQRVEGYRRRWSLTRRSRARPAPARCPAGWCAPTGMARCKRHKQRPSIPGRTALPDGRIIIGLLGRVWLLLHWPARPRRARGRRWRRGLSAGAACGCRSWVLDAARSVG
jgi:hypothetical protein